MDATTQTIQQIGRLLSAFPPPNFGGSKDDILRRYIEALDGFAVPDIAAGVDLIVKGRIPGLDSRFPPTPPQVSSAVRRAIEERVQRERWSRPPALPKPDVTDRTPESQARVKAMVDGFVKGSAKALQTEDAARAAGHDALVQRAHRRFDPDQDGPSLNSRLTGTAFTVGNDAEEEAA